MDSGHKHLSTLDSLRGFAALAVCLFHYTGQILPGVHIPALQCAFNWGWVGVDVFFVISGFVIPYVLTVGNYRLRDFGRFIGKRFVRICPPSYIVILLTLGLWWVFDHMLGTEHKYLADLSATRLLTNVLYLAPFFKHEWIVSVFWTLTIEFQFYLLVALVFGFAYKNLRSFIVFAAILCAMHYLPLKLDTYVFKQGTMFLMGGIASLYYTRRVSVAAFLAIGGALALVNYFQHGALSTAFSLATMLIVVFVKFKNPIGGFMGRISYSLYLVHLPTAPVFVVVFTKLISPGSDQGKALVQLLCVAMAVLCAYLYYLVVERYFVRLANRLFPEQPAPYLESAADPLPVSTVR